MSRSESVSDTVNRFVKAYMECKPESIIESAEIKEVIHINLYSIQVERDRRAEFIECMEAAGFEIEMQPGPSMYSFADEDTRNKAQEVWDNYLRKGAI